MIAANMAVKAMIAAALTTLDWTAAVMIADVMTAANATVTAMPPAATTAQP